MKQSEQLIKDFEAQSKELRSADMIVNSKIHKIYFRVMSGYTHKRALELSKIRTRTLETDGTELETVSYDEDLLRAHIILFQLRDKDGGLVFENNLSKIRWIQTEIDFVTQEYLAALMGMKSLTDIVAEQTEALAKMNG